MEDKEIIKLIENQLELIHYYKPFLSAIPGVQEPNVTLLFQTEIDLLDKLSELTGDDVFELMNDFP